MTAPLAVSLGDPAGIGPEVIAAAWARRSRDDHPFVVFGDAHHLGRTGAPVRVITDTTQARAVWDAAVPVIDLPLGEGVEPGRPSPDAAPCIVSWIEAAVRACLAGQTSALVTAPISKAILKSAGFAHPGHTEFIGALTEDVPWPYERGPVMMLAAADLRVSLATIHLPLVKVADELSIERLVKVSRVTAQALVRDFGIASPRLALAGLNPHAGESGEIGTEEATLITPAAEILRGEGHDMSGPLPADSLFAPEIRRRYDAIVCMYHDQALIPIKMLDFWGGVNITLGLPVIRTSPDHGTAFDIAGRGAARPDSLIAALRSASAIALRRSR